MRIPVSVFADLKFKAKDNPAKEQHDVDSLAETGNIILENDLTVLARQLRKYAFHNGDFGLPRLSRCCQRLAVIIVAQRTKYEIVIATEKFGEGAII